MASRQVKYQCIATDTEGKEYSIGADTLTELRKRAEQSKLRIKTVKCFRKVIIDDYEKRKD